MDLIKVLNKNSATDIIHPDGRQTAILGPLVKILLYARASGDITIVKYKNSMSVLNFKDIEDPTTPGIAFTSIDGLWNLLMQIYNSSTTQVTHLAIGVTFGGNTVTHT